MMFDAAAAETAVQKLSKRYRIAVHWNAPNGPEAHVGTRQVWVNLIEEPYDYLAALHELGHIVCPDSKRLGAKAAILACEAAAWEWALQNADPVLLPKVGRRTRKKIRDAWATYLDEEVP